MSSDLSEGTEAPAWFTEAQRGDWQCGDRVRVSLDECRLHGTREAGVTGTVLSVDAPETFKGSPAMSHPYLVWFDHPVGQKTPIEFWYYAASELRPYDPMAEILKEHAHDH